MDTWMFYAATAEPTVTYLSLAPTSPGSFSVSQLGEVVAASGFPPAPGVAMDCGSAVGNYSTIPSSSDCSRYRVTIEGDTCTARAESLIVRLASLDAADQDATSPPSPPPPAGVCGVAAGDVVTGSSFLYEDLTVVFGSGGAAILNSTSLVYAFHSAFSSDGTTLTVRDVAANGLPEFSTCNYTRAGVFDVAWAEDGSCDSFTLRGTGPDPCSRLDLFEGVTFTIRDETPVIPPKIRPKIDTASFSQTKLIRVVIVLASVLAFFIACNMCLASSKKHSSKRSSSSSAPPAPYLPTPTPATTTTPAATDAQV